MHSLPSGEGWGGASYLNKMIYKIIQPAIHLKSIVKDYLLLHYVFDHRNSTPIKPFPANTQHCLVFYLRGGVTAFNPKTKLYTAFPKISINGSQISRFDFHLSPQYLMFSINFQPGAMSKFLKTPLTTFMDKRIDAEAVLGSGISEIYEQMVNTNCYESLIQIVEEYLSKSIQKLKKDDQPIDKIAQLITQNPSNYTVDKMADLACLSISQFERRFVQQLGITPKFYARINRFYQAYQIKDHNPEADWFSVAIKTGYYDYQHLVKDFKEFAHTSPHSLIEAQAQSPERFFGIG